MKKVISFFDEHFEETIVLLLMVVFVTCIILQVFTRFLVHSVSMAWTEELSRYTFVWFVFMGIPWGIRGMAHLKIDTITQILAPKGKLIQSLLVHVAVILISIPLLYNSITVVQVQLELGQRLATLPIPMSLVYSCMPVGLALTILRCVQRIVLDIMELKAPKKEVQG